MKKHTNTPIDIENLEKHAIELGFKREPLYFTRSANKKAYDKYKDKYHLYTRHTQLEKYLEKYNIKTNRKIRVNFGGFFQTPQEKPNKLKGDIVYSNPIKSTFGNPDDLLRTIRTMLGEPNIKGNVLRLPSKAFPSYFVNSGDLFYKSLHYFTKGGNARSRFDGFAFEIPELSAFDGVELLSDLRQNDKSLVIALDCEWVELPYGRRVLSWQFAFIYGACLCEYIVFDVKNTHKQYSDGLNKDETYKDDLLDLDVVLQKIYGDLGLKSYSFLTSKKSDGVENIKNSNKLEYTYVKAWRDGEPVYAKCDGFDDIKDKLDSVYPYLYDEDKKRYYLSRFNISDLAVSGLIKSKYRNFDIIPCSKKGYYKKCVYKNGYTKKLSYKPSMNKDGVDKNRNKNNRDKTSYYKFYKSKFFYIKRYINSDDKRDISLRVINVGTKNAPKMVKRYVKINYYWFQREKSKNKHKYIDTTLVCHYGRVDVSNLKGYAKRYFKYSIDVQKGLITDKPLKYMIKDGSKGKAKNNYKYPVRLTIRDTMTLAGTGGKSLKKLGKLVGLEKLELPDGYSKDDMLRFLNEKPKEFLDYASRDAIITLLYSSMLFGYNGRIPFSFTSLTQRYFYNFVTNDDEDKGQGTDLGAKINAEKKRRVGFEWTDGESARVLFDRYFRGLELKGHGKKIGDDGSLVDLEDLEPINPNIDYILNSATKTFVGGFNASFEIGYYTNNTNRVILSDDGADDKNYHSFDYDMKNCYPTAMMMLNDWDTINPIATEFGAGGQPTEITLDVFKDKNGKIDPTAYIFGAVRFEYPNKKPKFPAIPVNRDGAIVFVNEVKENSYGSIETVWACGPEILRCLELGGRVWCYRGVKLNKFKDSVLARFSKYCILQRVKARKKYGKGSLQEELSKIFINAIYGKLSQALKSKARYSARLGLMQELGLSPISEPVRASMITSLIRACLNATLTAITDKGYNVWSVTTDGFISDIPEKELQALDLGLLTDVFRQSRITIDNNPDLWEIKHSNLDLYNMTTRGNVSSNVGGVFAKNGYKTPDGVGFGFDDRKHFILTTFNRPSGQNKYVKYINHTSTRFKKLVEGVELINEIESKSVSFNFDMKRKPVFNSAKEVEVKYLDNDEIKTIKVCNFSTEPYNTLEEFDYYREKAKEKYRLLTKSDLKGFEKRVKGIGGYKSTGSEDFKDIKQYITYHVKKIVPKIVTDDGKIADNRCNWIDEVSQVDVKVGLIDFVAKSYAPDMLDYNESFKRSTWNACSKNSRGTYAQWDDLADIDAYFKACNVTLCYYSNEERSIYQPIGVKIVTPKGTSTLVKFTGVRDTKTYLSKDDMLKVFKSFENAEEFAIDIDIEKD